MSASVNDLIAVIVPVYNVAPYLERCVNSIREQIYTNLEIILVDDGSTDNSGAMCDAYAHDDTRIKVIHQTNGGLSAARNAGLANATAQYVTFVDSDDYVDKDYVSLMHNTMQETGVPLVVCGVKKINLDGTITTTADGAKFVVTPREALLIMLPGGNIVSDSAYSKLYKSSLFEQVKFPVGHLCEDAAIMHLLLEQCDKVAIYALPIYNYCLRTDSLTNGTSRTATLPDFWFFHERAIAYAREKYPADRDYIDRCEMNLKIWAYQCLAVIKNVDPVLKTRLWRYLKQNRRSVLRRHILPIDQQRILRRTYFGRLGFTWDCRLREIYRRWRKRRRSKQ